ncbi:hypothetical protein ACVIN2_007725 [Bradyrhizobium sp. USDA 3650]
MKPPLVLRGARLEEKGLTDGPRASRRPLRGLLDMKEEGSCPPYLFIPPT